VEVISKLGAQQSAVRSIAWLGLSECEVDRYLNERLFCALRRGHVHGRDLAVWHCAWTKAPLAERANSRRIQRTTACAQADNNLRDATRPDVDAEQEYAMTSNAMVDGVRRIFWLRSVDRKPRNIGRRRRNTSGRANGRRSERASSGKDYARAQTHGPNENKMSDGWRDSASPRVEGGIS